MEQPVINTTAKGKDEYEMDVANEIQLALIGSPLHIQDSIFTNKGCPALMVHDAHGTYLVTVSKVSEATFRIERAVPE